MLDHGSMTLLKLGMRSVSKIQAKNFVCLGLGYPLIGKSSTSIPHNKGSLLLNIKFVCIMTPHAPKRSRENCVKAAVCEMLDKEEEESSPTRDYTLAVLCVPSAAVSCHQVGFPTICLLPQTSLFLIY